MRFRYFKKLSHAADFMLIDFIFLHILRKTANDKARILHARTHANTDIHTDKLNNAWIKY